MTDYCTPSLTRPAIHITDSLFLSFDVAFGGLLLAIDLGRCSSFIAVVVVVAVVVAIIIIACDHAYGHAAHDDDGDD